MGVLVWAGIELIFIIIACTMLFLIWDQNTVDNTRMLLLSKAHTASRSFLPSHTALSVNRLRVHTKLGRKTTRTADPN